MTSWRWMTVVTAVAVVATGCGSARQPEAGAPDATSPTAGSRLTGRIEVDGSSTVFPVTQLAAERFKAMHPQVDIAVGFSGTGGGFKKLCAGDIHIADASRPIKDDEREVCERSGISYIEMRVGLDGITNIVDADNEFVSCLTTDQLQAIWVQGSSVTRWNQVDQSFPDTGLQLFGPGPDSGTYDFFIEEIIGDPDEGARPRTDYSASEDDNVIVQGVAGTPGALGYVGFAYYAENRARLKGLAVDAGDGCIEPTEETIEDGQYHLSRPLFVYVAERALEMPHVHEFLRYYVQRSGELASAAGYVPLSEQAQQDALDTLQQASS